ncbi:MAG TPA: class I SAM-dependent methyltransferase [Chloroflexota bacterium]|jgi:SAM-dependent methyltransferase|nr:class I SAM-dependent methyltransferase [Chloroflexota bacterium]
MGIKSPAWLFDEHAHAGDEHLDAQYVATYDRKAGVDPAEDLALLRDLGMDGSSSLIDLGAGTGTLALAAAPLCRRVVAVDVSPAMLSRLSAQAERQGLRNVECVQGGFLTYEHRGEPGDFVYSRNALHHLPDFWKAIALQRIASILRPGGMLRLRDLVFSCEPAETEHVIEAWLAGAAKRSEDGWTRPELETHVREEHSTFSWLLEAMFEHAGFKIRQAEHSVSRIYTAYVCVKR